MLPVGCRTQFLERRTSAINHIDGLSIVQAKSGKSGVPQCGEADAALRKGIKDDH